MVQYRRIGEMLLEKGVIDKRQLAKAIKLQAKSGLRFGEILTAIGAASEEDITRCIAEQYDYPIADLAGLSPEPEALALLEQGFAISHLVLPVKITDTEFECVVADPVDVSTSDLIALNTRKRPRMSFAPPSLLLKAILAAYGLPPLEEHTFANLSDETPRAAAKPRKRKVDVQRDREALLALVGALPQPPVRRSLWSRLMGSAQS